MKSVQPREWVDPLHFSLCSLLPVNPPEIYPLLFHRVIQPLEVARHEFGVGTVKRNAIHLFRHHSHILANCGKLCFMFADSVGRMNVEGYFQILFFEIAQKRLMIREENRAPSESGPTGQMPIHINCQYIDWQLYTVELRNQLLQLFVSVSPIAAVPIAQRIAWRNRLTTENHRDFFQRSFVCQTISQQIQILSSSRFSRSDPQCFGIGEEIQRNVRGIVIHSPARSGEQSLTQSDRSIIFVFNPSPVGRTDFPISACFVQRSTGTQKIALILLSIMP